MNVLDSLLLGLATVFQPHHGLLVLLGCGLGALAGATRRVGVLALLAMLLPVLQQLDTVSAAMLFIGVYGGAHGGVRPGLPATLHGGAVPAVAAANTLACAPTPMVTLLAGLIGAAAVVAWTPLLIEQAFRFGPAEYFSLTALGLTAFVVLGPGSLVKSMATLVMGVMLSQLSVEPASGLALFHFDLAELEPGIGLVPMAMGLAVIARVTTAADRLAPGVGRASTLAPPRAGLALRYQWPQLLRGALIGSVVGPAPGGGLQLGGHLALAAEDRLLRRAGAVGVDPVGNPASAAAVVAAVRGSLVPMLAWGFPVNASLALLAGLMAMRQVTVGPQLMTSRPDLFWGTIAALALVSLVMAVAGRLLAPLTAVFGGGRSAWLPGLMAVYAGIAVYTVRHTAFDILVMAAFALLGHCLIKLGCRVGPMILGFVLGPAMESNLRHALELSGGHWEVLVTRPISAGLLLAAAGVSCAVMLPSLRQWRARIFDLED